MTRSMSKSIFLHRERGVWEALQRHRTMLLRSNEHLAWRSTEVADLTSWCEGLKEEGTTDYEEVHRRRAKVLGLKAEADCHKGVLRHAQEGLQAVMMERDSLTKSLEDEQSECWALNTRIGCILPMSCFVFRVWSCLLVSI
jgi:hypothetical protein